jgi:hypothetical protein
VRYRKVAISGEADWGNIRYGKAFRTEHALKTLGAAANLSRVRRCLDVGANRGSFVLGLRALAPKAEILSVEPDRHIVKEYVSVPRIRLRLARIEDMDLAPEAFDIIHCSHTLEHVASPRAVLEKLRKALAPEGLLFLEVPAIEFLARKDIIEEWFIDKHLYHFSTETLSVYLRVCGFWALSGFPVMDGENITILARGAAAARAQAAVNARAAARSTALIRRYRASLCHNRATLRKSARRIEALAAKRRLVVWGAGRIFDTLVRQGCLDVRCLAGVVDKYLPNFVPKIHGCRLIRPKDLPALRPEVLLVASRSYLDEIRAEAARLVPSCRTLALEDLLRNGRTSG